MKGFNAAQAAHDAEEAPEYYEDDEGGCDHSWKFLGSADGDDFYKCRKCGAGGEN